MGRRVLQRNGAAGPARRVGSNCRSALLRAAPFAAQASDRRTSALHAGWLGTYWANPISYFFRALVINEFTSSDWAQPVEPGSSISLGEAVLASRCVRCVHQAARLRGKSQLCGMLSDVPPAALSACRGFSPDYFYVWIAIFVWGIGSSALNFALFVWALTNLSRTSRLGAASSRLHGCAGTACAGSARLKVHGSR